MFIEAVREVIMKKALHHLYRLAALVGGLSYAIALIFLVLKFHFWFVMKTEPSANFYLIDYALVAAWLDWLFMNAMEVFLYTACVYIPLNFFFGNMFRRNQ